MPVLSRRYRHSPLVGRVRRCRYGTHRSYGDSLTGSTLVTAPVTDLTISQKSLLQQMLSIIDEFAKKAPSAHVKGICESIAHALPAEGLDFAVKCRCRVQR